MENKAVWIERGNQYIITASDFTAKDKLPKGIYLLKENREGLYLEKTSDQFEINFKVYDMETEFMDHVMTTFENTDRNLGILLNGKKGTGKSLTAKLLANKMDIPVIMVTSNYDGLSEFLGSIKDECIIFFDEFEKTFQESEGAEMLSIMDGAYTANGRKVFILTTNKTNINENFLGRPSRIRYKREFDDISEKVITDYCADHLKHAEFFDDLKAYLKKLDLVTIDILATLVQEINIHHKSISSISEFLNLEESSYNVGYYSFAISLDNFQITDMDIFKPYLNLKAIAKIFKEIKKARKQGIEVADLDYTLNGKPVKSIRNLLYTDQMPDNCQEWKFNEWCNGFSHGDGYCVCPYDPEHKVVVLYDDDKSRLIFYQIEYCYACSSLNIDKLFKD